MTLRTKLAAFHARIHSHRRHPHRKDKEKHHHHSHHRKHSPPRKPTPRDSLSSTSSTTSSSHSHSLSPVLTLIVPTTSHDLNVEARVYHPSEFPSNYGVDRTHPRKAAVVAHPYASLGGSWDDPVVLSLVSLLIRKGWVVATFNFGGAGNSKGKTSWTGAPEREEYATIAAFLVKYVECLDPHSFAHNTRTHNTDNIINTTPATVGVSNGSTTATGDIKEGGKPAMKVLLAGYSYGSLIASRIPSADKILKSVDCDVLAYATRTAYEWASTEKRRSFAMHRGVAAGMSPWCADLCDEEEEQGETSGSKEPSVVAAAKDKVNYEVQMKLETHWLLVSPLLPPVSILLNLPNPLSWFHRSKKNEHDESEEEAADEGGDERDMLVVYGTNDMFTGVGRYRNWIKGRTTGRRKGEFHAVEVEGAGHFWMQEEAWMVRLREGVAAWIDALDHRNGMV
ncbi:hypothetical protein TWF694_010194 [Orbilia ellipsospora]|uniref:AB hydrolase-1 domain-containing protein n=1 Tax=Orbilia ellipsospora TaxID=2528407 RepID=A0AAV9XAF4_9PEZI